MESVSSDSMRSSTRYGRLLSAPHGIYDKSLSMMTGAVSSDSLNTSEELTVKATEALGSGMISTLLKEKSITLFLGKVME